MSWGCCVGFGEVKSSLAAHAGLKQEDVKALDLVAARQLILQLKASLQARELQLERNMEEVASVRGNMEQVMVSQLSAQHRPAHFVMRGALMMHAHVLRPQDPHRPNDLAPAPRYLMSVRRGG